MSLEVIVVESSASTRDGRGLGPWLARSGPKSARGEIIVAIVGDARMRGLNQKFRGVDSVTDVLSFPVEKSGRTPFAGRRGAGHFLGEIVISRGLAARQARTLGHPLGTELRILALHGLLHLLGYDHEVDEGQMARVERRLRRRAGLPQGLIARSS